MAFDSRIEEVLGRCVRALDGVGKIDFIVRKARSYSRHEFERRRAIELFGTPISIAAAEDSVISKLEWAKLGSSERQLEDARRIIASVVTSWTSATSSAGSPNLD